MDRTAISALARRRDRERSSKADRIYSELKRLIVTGELAPAAPIDKGDLCTRFGVSRFPVTTAVNRLAYERLVVIEPQKGSYVAKIRLADVKEWLIARRALETEIAETCATRLGKAGTERLGRSLSYQNAAVESDDVDGFHELDIDFHRQMVDGLGLARIGDILEGIRTHIDRVRRLLLPEPGRMAETLEEHRAIHVGIRDSNGVAAAHAMRLHVDRVLDSLLEFEKRRPDFFSE